MEETQVTSSSALNGGADIITKTKPTTSSSTEHLSRSTLHFRPRGPGYPFHRVSEELVTDLGGDDVRTMRNFPKAFLDQITQFYPLVRNVDEIVQLPRKLTGDSEFGFSPMFAPLFVDVTARQGMFPMAIDFHKEVMAFTPKCHVERAFSKVLVEVKDDNDAVENEERDREQKKKSLSWKRFERECFSPSLSGSSLVPAFDLKALGYDKKLAKKLRVSVVHKISLATEEGIAAAKKVGESLQMVFEQHTEHWLCRQLRACVGAMMKEPESAATTFVFILLEQDMSVPHVNPPKKATPPPTPTVKVVPKPKSAVERKKMKKAEQSSKKATPAPPVESLLSESSPLVACEIGYIVGDIYTSYTGAYVVSGTGSISLAVTAKIISLLGVRTWDLGMQMKYKEDSLGCETMKRAEWLSFAQGRVSAITAKSDESYTGEAPPPPSPVNPFLSNKWTQSVLDALKGPGVNVATLLAAETAECLGAGRNRGGDAEEGSLPVDSHHVELGNAAEKPLSKAQQKKLAKEAFIRAKKSGTLTEKEILEHKGTKSA